MLHNLSHFHLFTIIIECMTRKKLDLIFNCIYIPIVKIHSAQELIFLPNSIPYVTHLWPYNLSVLSPLSLCIKLVIDIQFSTSSMWNHILLKLFNLMYQNLFLVYYICVCRWKLKWSFFFFLLLTLRSKIRTKSSTISELSQFSITLDVLLLDFLFICYSWKKVK